jgi:hypothetical protein
MNRLQQVLAAAVLTVGSLGLVTAPALADMAAAGSLDARASGLVQKGVTAYDGLSGYQAMLHRETPKKDSRKMRVDEMFLRYDKPSTIFMKYTAGRQKSLQVLWSDGNFGGKIMTRPPGPFFDFIPIQAMDPEDKRITREEARPLKDAGIGHMINQFAREWSDGQAAGKAKVESIGPASDDQGLTRLQVRIDAPNRQYAREAIYFRDADGLPVGVEFLTDQGAVVESYRYSAIKANPAKDDAELTAAMDPRLFSEYYSKI